MPLNRSALLEGLDSFIPQALRDWNVPGLSVTVVKDDDVVLAKGYGVREVGGSDPVDEHTLFGIGSNTKAFTATALGLLVQEGRLSWDDRVAERLPGYAFYNDYVTSELLVRDLLCHRSGLPTYGGDLMLYTNYSREQMVARHRYLKPAYGFRAVYGYTNQMFIVAGQLILAVTGQTWDEFVTERLFAPLGMQRSNTTVAGLQAGPNAASSHLQTEAGPAARPYRSVDAAGAAGSINSSAIEMAQWLRLQLGEGEYEGRRIVDAAVIRETRTPHTNQGRSGFGSQMVPTQHFSLYGLGWHLMDYQGRLLISHGGHVDGMLSRTAFMPEERLAVGVFTNAEDHELNSALPLHIFDAVLGVPARDWTAYFKAHGRVEQPPAPVSEKSAKAAASSLPLAGYTGLYHNPVFGNAMLSVQGDGMRLQSAEHPGLSGDMTHWDGDSFRCQWDDKYFLWSVVPFKVEGGNPVEFVMQIRPEWLDPTAYVFKKHG